jgi:acetolactate synthase-1/3 small subunit
VKHTIVAAVVDEPGVLNRVASLFRRRAFNIASLTVGASERPGLSRLTVVVDTRTTPARLVEENLRKLVPVVEVRDVTHQASVSRELALLRVRCAPGERPELAGLAAIFRGRIVDVAPDSVVVEVTGDEEKVDGLADLLRPRGLLEMVRTGRVAILRGTADNDKTTTETQRHREQPGVNGNEEGRDAQA